MKERAPGKAIKYVVVCLLGMVLVTALLYVIHVSTLRRDFESALSLPEDAEYTVTVGSVLGRDEFSVTGGLANRIISELDSLSCAGRVGREAWQPKEGDYDLFITSEETGLTTITLFSGGERGELVCPNGNIELGGTEGLYQLVENALNAGGLYPEGSAMLWPRFTAAEFSQAIVTSDKVYSQPGFGSAPYPYCSLEGQYCLVLAQCIAGTENQWSSGSWNEFMDDGWVLIAFFSPEMPANLGWVPLECCTEYTEETKSQMRGVFSAREGAKVYDADGKASGRTAKENDIYYIVDGVPDENGLISLGWVGTGMTVKLSAGDLIYPEVGLDYFDGVLPPGEAE